MLKLGVKVGVVAVLTCKYRCASGSAWLDLSNRKFWAGLGGSRRRAGMSFWHRDVGRDFDHEQLNKRELFLYAPAPIESIDRTRFHLLRSKGAGLSADVTAPESAW